jgi:hypothetical protein
MSEASFPELIEQQANLDEVKVDVLAIKVGNGQNSIYRDLCHLLKMLVYTVQNEIRGKADLLLEKGFNKKKNSRSEKLAHILELRVVEAVWYKGSRLSLLNSILSEILQEKRKKK